jgi:hypothetical protein
MARKKKKKKQAKVWTNVQILADWKKAVNKGLRKKKLHPDITTEFKQPLLDKIQTRLDAGHDYNKDGPKTRAVGRTLGIICRLLADGSTVSLAVFEASFKACKLHPKCRVGGGSGQWCNV